jgi:hypothetical protein
MKIFINKINRISGFIFSVALFAAGSGCSYVSDAIEGAITERAAFSINASYNSAAQEVTITWDETGSSNFAGYEIYITEEQDNEYAGYLLIESRWRDQSDSYVGSGNNEDLDDFYTSSYTHDVSGIVSGSDPNGPGAYFYRIGIIDWDDDLEDRTSENGYNPYYDPSSPLDTSWDAENNYNNHTGIDKISGYVQVNIF